MKYSITDEISNVLALSAKNDSDFYDYSKNVKSVSERFIRASDQLSEEEYLGWQLCFDKDGQYHSLAFSKAGINITKDDLEWIFQDCAAPDESDQGLFTDMFTESRKVYYLSCPPVRESETNERSQKEKNEYDNEYDIDVLSALKEFDAAVRIIASAESSGKGIILFSFPEEATLKMKTILSFVFADMPLIRTDNESVLPESARVSSKWILTGMQGLLKALYYEQPDEQPDDESTEENDDKHFISDEDEDEDDIEYFITDEDEDDDVQDDVSKTENPDSAADDKTSIEELNLSMRSLTCLRRAGVHTVGQLKSMTDDDLVKVRNLGRNCVEEIKQKLEEYRPVSYSVTKTAPTYMEMLNELIGLENVKEQVGKIAALARMKQDMDSSDNSTLPIVLNMEFVGNPGTAKTTVARIVAGLFYEIGLLKRNEIVEVGRADLVAKYVGHTADKVRSVFKKAKGKLLFIDEAYSLVENYRGEYGDEAINTIVQEMENNRADTIVIFAGYPDEMQEFFSRNPGLRSRVPFSISFCDYTAEEMVRISESDAKNRGFSIASGAKDKLAVICGNPSGTITAGNGRFCRNLVEKAILNYASRVYGNADGTVCKDYTLIENDFALPDTLKTSETKPPIGFQV